jgi:hypothetical protein
MYTKQICNFRAGRGRIHNRDGEGGRGARPDKGVKKEEIIRNGKKHRDREMERKDGVTVVQHSAYALQRNPIYVFPEKELCGLSPTVHIQVSVSDLYIPKNRSTYFPTAE